MARARLLTRRQDAPATDRLTVARPMPAWKRGIDLVVASASLLLLAPLFALLALIVHLDSPGPVFFGQVRVGRDGRHFTCWKFRSMCADAEDRLTRLTAENQARGPMFKMQDDPRRTRSGKLLRKSSLDELPQLWNVLRGEMSLVGPRPPLPREVGQYEPRHYARLAGVPGITGLWQVRARHHHDFEEMYELDVQYLQHLSFINDMRILLATVPAVLCGRGSH
jgi:lipopolysaccharide/colanic/teichoic acid biosynthesis glycosyltransferase